jgi:hypothetical protein
MSNEMTDIIKLAREAGIKNDCDGIWCEADQLRRFAELVAAPLKADAERLDWMNLAGNRYAFHLSGTWYSRKDHSSPFKKHSNIRAAIDAARAKEQT